MPSRWIHQLRYASGKSLEFQISKSGQSWLWPPRFGELIGKAGCSNAKLHQTNSWLDLSALDNIGEDSGLIWLDRDSSGWLVGGWRTIRIISEEEARWISPPRSQWLCCNSKISGGDYRLLRRIQQLSHSRTDFIKSAMSLLSHCTVSHVIHVTCDTLSSALSLSHHFLFRLCLFAGITPWLPSCNSLLFVLTK